MQFVKDPGFHLIRSLICKGYSKDVPVQFRICNDQTDKIAGKGVGFTGAGRCFIYCETGQFLSFGFYSKNLSIKIKILGLA